MDLVDTLLLDIILLLCCSIDSPVVKVTDLGSISNM